MMNETETYRTRRWFYSSLDSLSILLLIYLHLLFDDLADFRILQVLGLRSAHCKSATWDVPLLHIHSG